MRRWFKWTAGGESRGRAVFATHFKQNFTGAWVYPKPIFSVLIRPEARPSSETQPYNNKLECSA